MIAARRLTVGLNAANKALEFACVPMRGKLLR